VFLASDDSLEKIIARNDAKEQKTMLYLAEFGRYLEALEKGVTVFVCPDCLDVRLAEEQNEKIHCFRKEEGHAWQEFHERPALEQFLRENIAKHYARA
jgi:hypothetical protein